MLTDTMLRIPLDQIEVSRDTRQRRRVDVSDIVDSIRLRGVVTPIVVERLGDDKYLLVAGERRCTASRSCGIPDIPARLASSLSAEERQIIELEENLKRSDLEWKDSCEAIRRIHELYTSLDASWTQRKTAESISMSEQNIAIILRVAQELRNGNSLIEEAPHYRAAYNILARRDSRKLDDAFNDLVGEENVKVEPVPSTVSPPDPSRVASIIPERPKPTEYQDSILIDDFCIWAYQYSGPPFSFLHCDFPYGIGLDQSDQGNTVSWGSYDDSEATYWKLCGVLAERLDQVMAPYSHLMFWISSDFTIIHKTLQFFSAKAPSLDFNPKPLIWMKTDGKGILPDPKRGPRHIYETALFASRGDRLIAQPVADAYGAPKGNSIHQSEKPEPMLRHFFRMFIDDGTSVLDPTCGSGTSLRAAESLGSKRVLGLEINKEWAEDARKLLQRARILKKAEITLEGLSL